MIPSVPTVQVSRREYEALLAHRLAAIEAFLAQSALVVSPPGSRPAGLRGVLRVHGRTREGHLKASIRCSAPGLRSSYTRRVRLVPSSAYTDPLELELRLA